TDHGSRLALLRDAGAVRRGLLRQFQMQSESHIRVSQPVELLARALSVAGNSRDHRHYRHQARLLLDPRRQSDRHRAPRTRRSAADRAARPRVPSRGCLTIEEPSALSSWDSSLRLGTLARRLQRYRADNSKTWYTCDDEEERPINLFPRS